MNTSRIVRSSDRATDGPHVSRAAQADARRATPPMTSGDARTDIRFNLALRLDGLERDQPAVLDLLADAHAAFHSELHGRASALCGDYTERNWRAVLVGERDLRVKDLCRLSLAAHPWAKAAVVAALRVVLRAIGYDVVPIAAAPIDNTRELIAEVSVDTAAVVSDLAHEDFVALEADVAKLDQVDAVLHATLKARHAEARA